MILTDLQKAFDTINYTILSIKFYSTWYPNLNKGFKKKLQVTQNKCIRFCLQLGNMSHMGAAEFDKINWLPIDDRFNQCVSSKVFKFFQEKCPSYMSEIFYPSGTSRIGTRTSYLKLIQPSRRSSLGQDLSLTRVQLSGINYRIA